MGMGANINVKAVRKDGSVSSYSMDASKARECFIFVFDDAEEKKEIETFKVSIDANGGYHYVEGGIVMISKDGRISQFFFRDVDEDDDEFVVGEKEFPNHPDLFGFCVYIESFHYLQRVKFEMFMDRFLDELNGTYFEKSSVLTDVIEKKKIELNNPSKRQGELVILQKTRTARFVFKNVAKEGMNNSFYHQIVSKFVRCHLCPHIRSSLTPNDIAIDEFHCFEIVENHDGKVNYRFIDENDQLIDENDQLIDRIMLLSWCGCRYQKRPEKKEEETKERK